MDGRRMNADGGSVVQRERRARKLAVVVAVQNVLVVACLLATLYVYCSVQKQQPSEDNIHASASIESLFGNGTLQFNHINSINKMVLLEENKFYINCTGPYIFYMDVCYKSLNNGTKASGTVQLQVADTPVISLNLQTSGEVCRGLHSIAYLRAKEEASLHLNTEGAFKITEGTVVLSSLLGRKCSY